MKWIIGGVLLLLYMNSQQSATPALPGMTNQPQNPNAPLGFAQRIAQVPSQIIYDITGAPTTPGNSSTAVGTPASNPNFMLSHPNGPDYGM